MLKQGIITSKELDYVSLWASKIPMPGEEYSRQVVEQMKECYEIYKRIYQNKEYSLIFSNGEEINFEIMASNLCHMLGVDYKNIKSDYFENYRKNVLGITSCTFSSFELLEAILENAEKVIELDNDTSNKEKILNYYKSQIKCIIFKKLSDFKKFDFGAINFDPKDGEREYDKQKLLFVPSNEAVCPYFLMGIKISNPEEEIKLQKYIVNTLMAPKQGEIKNFFKEQEVIIPTQILVSNNDSFIKNSATAADKIRLLTMYKAIINEYGIPNKLNISGDYEAMLNVLNSYENAEPQKTL